MSSRLVAVVVFSGLLFSLPLSLLGLSLSVSETVRPIFTRAGIVGLARRTRGHLTPGRVAPVLLAAVLVCWNVTGSPGYVEDEGTYTAQAWSIFHGHLAPYFYTYDHPPLAWLQMAPLLWVLHLIGLGSNSVEAARFVMAAAAVVDVALLAVIVRRLRIHPVVAWSTLVFVLTSPLTLEYMRHVYIDNIALTWMLAALALVLGSGGSRRYWLAGIFMGISALSKETMLLVWPAIALAAWTNSGTPGWASFKRRAELEMGSESSARSQIDGAREKGFTHRLRDAGGTWLAATDRQRDAVKSLTVGTFLVGILYPMMALFLGEFRQLWNSIYYQLAGRAGSGSVFTEGTARSAIVHHWASLDWLLLIVGLGCGVFTIVTRRFRWIALALAVPLIQVVRTGGYLPYMALIVALPFLALGIAALGTQVVRRVNRVGRAAILVLMVGAALVGSMTHIYGAGFTKDKNANVNESIQWVTKHTPQDSRVLSDDVVFAALTQSGRPDIWNQSVYVYKLDYDPQAKKRIPNGWRGINYVVQTPMFVGSLDPQMHQAGLAYKHSVPVASFGSGADQVIVRRVVSTPGS